MLTYNTVLKELKDIPVNRLEEYGLLYKDAKKQLKKFTDFVELNKVIPMTMRTAKIAAEIHADLRKKGREIGHTDTLIAGIAIANDLLLITNNKNPQGSFCFSMDGVTSAGPYSSLVWNGTGRRAALKSWVSTYMVFPSADSTPK